MKLSNRLKRIRSKHIATKSECRFITFPITGYKLAEKKAYLLPNGLYEKPISPKERLETMEKLTIFPFKRYIDCEVVRFFKTYINPRIDAIYGRSIDDLVYLIACFKDPNLLALIHNVVTMLTGQCVIEIDSVNPNNLTRIVNVRHSLPSGVYEIGKDLLYLTKLIAIVAQATNKTERNIMSMMKIDIDRVNYKADFKNPDSYTYDVFSRRDNSFIDRNLPKQHYHVMSSVDEIAVEFKITLPPMSILTDVSEKLQKEGSIENKFISFCF